MKRTYVLVSACFLVLSSCGYEEIEPSGFPDAEILAEQSSALEAMAATRDDNMALGNPSNATASPATPANFLIKRPQYTLSYNNSRGGPNWVSWHLSTAWKGSAQRSTTFTSDTTLPSDFVRVASSWYLGTGFDRGHMCPSEDRDGSPADNEATFILTNIEPQAPDNNQQTWRNLENYSRTLINAGNELYIIAGSAGVGGSGSAGSASTIHSGQVTVPKYVWKVIVVLPVGSNDVSRINTHTRVIAVKMPNDQTVEAHPWSFYRTSVNEIEILTGYNFLSKVPASIQNVIEATVDHGPDR